MVNKAGRKGFSSSGGGSGTTVTHHNANRGFSPFPVRGVTSALTSSNLQAGLNAGVTEVSGNVVHTLGMPLAADAIGATYIIRSTSAHAHILSGSQEANGTLVFTDGTDHGSRLTLGGAVGDSVVLKCDGVSYIVLGSSGSLTIAGA